MKKMIMSVAMLTAVTSVAAAQETVTYVQGPALAAQPTTLVQSTPLTLSRAEQMRKAREQQEVETEQKIVERLEESRLEAESKRQSDMLGALNTKKEEPKADVVVVAPTVQQAVVAAPVVAAPAPVVVAAPVEVQKPMSIEDVRGAVREELAVKTPLEPIVAVALIRDENYIIGTVGTMDYGSPDVEAGLALGMNFGRTFDRRWSAEIRTGIANAYVSDNAFMYKDMTQYNFGLGAKVNILTDRIRPYLGMDVSSVYRSYSEQRDSATGFPFPGSELNSWAIDYGFIAGLDVVLSRNLSLGLEYKYVSNLTYRFDNEVLNTPAYRNAYGPYGTWDPIEGRDSSMFGFLVKYVF